MSTRENQSDTLTNKFAVPSDRNSGLAKEQHRLRKLTKRYNAQSFDINPTAKSRYLQSSRLTAPVGEAPAEQTDTHWLRQGTRGEKIHSPLRRLQSDE